MIRAATALDAPAIAPLIISAMGELSAKLTNSEVVAVQTRVFERFVGQPANQYSYENILVYESNNQVCGMALAYDGGRLHELRAPFLSFVRSEMGFTGTPEDETKAGEYYLDAVAVAPEKQGRGIANLLINAILRKAALLGHPTVGLLVSNPKAKRVYKTIGFVEAERLMLLGIWHDHMQKNTDCQ